MDDPRFKHVGSDPRFKTIPKRSRKVTIDSRFQSMFTDKKFKAKYDVDKRGRKVKQTSSENLKKYYELEGAADQGEEAERSKMEDTLSDAESAHLSEDSSSADDSDSDGTDSELPFGEGQGGLAREMEAWREDLESVPRADEVSRRLAVCNMEWDRIEAKDIFVLLNSFKPAGASLLSVKVYPSDFGLQRLASEEVSGPVVEGLSGDDHQDQVGGAAADGSDYSTERLRQYQLSRLKYYYAVVECDSEETADHLYSQCNGLEYEHSGGQLDLRFIPDEMTFDDRQPKSVAREDLLSADFTPADFVSSALQQSKVKLTWDETDPRRVKMTQRNFTREDIQSMNFSAYLASSSEGSEEEGEERETKASSYKALLEPEDEDKADDGPNEEMEITWEPGLRETVAKEIKKKKKKEEQTPWEKYLQKRKEHKKEMKLKRVQKTEEKAAQGSDSGFDDPFFQHSVTTATAKTTKRKRKRESELDEAQLRDRDELELLLMSDGEEESREKRHFSLASIMQSEKEAKKKKKRKGETVVENTDKHVDNFKVDVTDPRFEALYESHLYAPDPSAPQFRATRGMTDIMAERQRRVKERGLAEKQGDASLNLLVKSVKNKTAAFKARRTVSKTKKRQHRTLG